MSRICHDFSSGAVTISGAVVANAEELVEVYRSVLNEERYFITSSAEYDGSVPRHRRDIQRLTKMDNSCYLVAKHAGHIVGAVTVRGGMLRRMRHVGKLEIFVAEASRGRGVGRELMQAALKDAIYNATLRKIGLTVYEDNHRAVSLYKSLGFVLEGKRLGEYMDDDGRLRDELMMCYWVDRGDDGLTEQSIDSGA